MQTQSRIIIIRHAESHANIEGEQNPAKWFSDSDKITSSGIQQISAIVKELKELNIDEIICSDMPRAHETAKKIAETLGKTTITVTPELREQRISNNILQKNQLNNLVKSWQKGVDLTFDGGESIAEFIRRITDVLTPHTKSHKTILVVSHEGVINVLQAQLSGEDPIKARPKTTPYCTGRILSWQDGVFWRIQHIPHNKQFLDNLPLRKTLVAIVMQQGKMLIVHKKGHPPQTWTFPQGGKNNFKETDIQTIQRELKEELNIKKIEIVKKLQYTQVFDWPPEYEGHKGFRGMEMNFYIVQLKQKEITVDDEELDAAKFVNAPDLQEYIDFDSQYGYGQGLKKHLKDIHEHNN